MNMETLLNTIDRTINMAKLNGMVTIPPDIPRAATRPEPTQIDGITWGEIRIKRKPQKIEEMIRASLLASFHQTPSNIAGVAVVARSPNAHRILVTKNLGGLWAPF